MFDDVEEQYARAISRAVNRGDNDEALYYSNGLAEYRKYYKSSLNISDIKQKDKNGRAKYPSIL